MIVQLRNDLKQLSDPEKGKLLQRFFKTGKGEYAEGDIFLGVTVPQSRGIANRYKRLEREEVMQLLRSRIHEERLIALFILVSQFTKGDEYIRKEIYDMYLANSTYINNWDLVDSSAHKIVGAFLWEHLVSNRAECKRILKKLAESDNLWERRIAMIATFAFIGHGESDMTLMIADILLHDKHDLIHKAVGWSLREVGKRVSQDTEVAFLKTRYKTMPRTMLRYAIERFPEEQRKQYLVGTI